MLPILAMLRTVVTNPTLHEGDKITPPVGSAAHWARVAELEDARELDSLDPSGSCRFESGPWYALEIYGVHSEKSS